jgi:hypothetical protein
MVTAKIREIRRGWSVQKSVKSLVKEERIDGHAQGSCRGWEKIDE